MFNFCSNRVFFFFLNQGLADPMSICMHMRYIAAEPVGALVYPSYVLFTCSLAGVVLNVIVSYEQLKQWLAR